MPMYPTQIAGSRAGWMGVFVLYLVACGPAPMEADAGPARPSQGPPDSAIADTKVLPTDAAGDEDRADSSNLDGSQPDGATSAIGRSCTDDTDCEGLHCVQTTDASMWGGGPAHGYCTKPCAAADDPACAALGAVCLDFGAGAGQPDQAFCVETCSRGGVRPDLSKCHARKEVSCTPSSVVGGAPSTEGFCLPACNSNTECGTRHCDPRLGVCVDKPVTGDPTGAPCDPAAGSAHEAGADGGAGCAGVCLSVGASTHVCAQRCAYGSPDACNLPGALVDGGIAAYSACIFVAAGTGPGDEAHCGQLCDTVHDCLDQADPGVFCDTSGNALQAYGHGFCNWGDVDRDAGSD